MSVRTGKEPRQLRPYQLEAAQAVEADWAAGHTRVGVVLPTGAGKSTVIGKLVSDAYHRGQKIVMLAHRAELIDQMIRDLKEVDPTIPDSHIGVVRADLNEHQAPIVGATLQTLAKAPRRQALGKRDVIIWDEVHHAPALGYHATFTELGGYDAALMCGFTATMYRADVTKGKTEQIGLGDVIQKISYERNLRWAIEEGYLVPPTGLTVRIGELNALNEIKNVAGDFNQADLAEVMEAAVEYTVDAIEMHARDRRSIVFAASVEASKQIAEQINLRGNLKAVSTTGAMSYEERQPVYQAFREGEVNVLVTVMVLTEGADFPMCDCVVMARPTRSRVLYSQMVGRALRLYEDKQDALVLDLSGTTRQMRLIHLSELVHGMGIDIKEVDEDGEEIICEVCDLVMSECVCEKEPQIRISSKRQGVVDMVTIDLLADTQSDVLWLETPAGVPFISLTDGWMVFIWPKDSTRDQWAVGYINTAKKNPDKTPVGGWYELDDDNTPVYYPMATAIKHAQQWAVDSKLKVPKRLASWRTKNQPPSEMQTDLAHRLGIPGYAGMTRGRLSDEISIHFAARLLDPSLRDQESTEVVTA